MPDFKKLISTLARRHGELTPPPARGPFELVLWENACYLLTDERRTAGNRLCLVSSAWFPTSGPAPPGQRWRLSPFIESRIHRIHRVARLTSTLDCASILAHAAQLARQPDLAEGGL
jgi:endonuclease-3